MCVCVVCLKLFKDPIFEVAALGEEKKKGGGGGGGHAQEQEKEQGVKMHCLFFNFGIDHFFFFFFFLGGGGAAQAPKVTPSPIPLLLPANLDLVLPVNHSQQINRLIKSRYQRARI